MRLMKYKNIKRIVDYFNKPYDLLKNKRIKIIYSVGGPVFILLFLFIFGPFGIVLFSDIIKLYLLSSICLAGAVILIVHIYVLQNFLIKKYTVGKTVVWLAWMNFVIGLSNFIIYEMFFNKGDLNWNGLPSMLFQTYLIGLLPILFIIVLYNSYFLKKKIKLVNQINMDLSQIKNETFDEFDLTLTSKNMRGIITVDSNSVLYITSADNYVEIHCMVKDQVKKSYLRNTLTEIEKEIKKHCNHFERCHNSFIINVNQIKTVSGNSGGYNIMLNNINIPIPISRKYANRFINLQKELKQL